MSYTDNKTTIQLVSHQVESRKSVGRFTKFEAQLQAIMQSDPTDEFTIDQIQNGIVALGFHRGDKFYQRLDDVEVRNIRAAMLDTDRQAASKAAQNG